MHKMSGYQVQTPNFFVALNKSVSIDAQVSLLQASFYQTSKSSSYNSSNGNTTLDAAVCVISEYFCCTGNTAFELIMPSAVDLLHELTSWNASNKGNQVVNIPGNAMKRSFGNNSLRSDTIRQYYYGVQPGFYWPFTFYNGNVAGDVTLKNGDKTLLNNDNIAIAPGQIAIIYFIITSTDVPEVHATVAYA